MFEVHHSLPEPHKLLLPHLHLGPYCSPSTFHFLFLEVWSIPGLNVLSNVMLFFFFQDQTCSHSNPLCGMVAAQIGT